MKKRSGAVHVARIVRKYKDREYVSFLLRRTYRENGKIRHETLGNISALPEEAIKAVQATLAGRRLVVAADAFGSRLIAGGKAGARLLITDATRQV
jgi:hypothetical protein